MWVAGTVRVSHCDHNSFSGTAEYMRESSIQNPAKPAVLFFFFFFFFCHDLVWPLRDVLSFAILDRGFYGALYFFALQQQIKPFRQKEWLTVESLYSWQPIDC